MVQVDSGTELPMHWAKLQRCWSSINQEKRTQIRVHAVLFVVQFMWALMVIMLKYTAVFIPPTVTTAFRGIVATPPLFIAAKCVEKAPRPTRAQFVQLGILGFFGVALNQTLLINGLLFTTAMTATALTPSVPVMTTAISVALKREAKSWWKFLGIASAIVGILIMVQIEKFNIFGSSLSLLGNLMVLINCVSFSIYLVRQKTFLDTYPFPIATTGWVFFFGAIFISIAAVLFIEDFLARVGGMPWLGWAAIVYAGITSSIGYTANSWATKKSSVVVVSIYTCLQPVFGSVLAALILGEGFTWRQGVGAPFIVLGVVLVAKAKNDELKKAAIKEFPIYAQHQQQMEEVSLEPFQMVDYTNSSLIVEELAISYILETVVDDISLDANELQEDTTDTSAPGTIQKI